MTTIDDGTIAGLLFYLDDLLTSNRAESSKITPLKSAVKRVFSSAGGTDWKYIDVRKVDVDNMIERFRYFCKDSEFNEDTFAAYRARINRAIKWYKTYLDDKGWSPFKKADSLESLLNIYFRDFSAKSEAQQQRSNESSTKVATYPFPLASGGEAQLSLPVDLSRRDAERLKTFIDALVVKENS